MPFCDRIFFCFQKSSFQSSSIDSFMSWWTVNSNVSCSVLFLLSNWFCFWGEWTEFHLNFLFFCLKKTLSDDLNAVCPFNLWIVIKFPRSKSHYYLLLWRSLSAENYGTFHQSMKKEKNTENSKRFYKRLVKKITCFECTLHTFNLFHAC